MSAGKKYIMGDTLRGEITLEVSKLFLVDRITGTLEYVMKGQRETSAGPATVITITGNLSAEYGQAYKFPFELPEKFDRVNYAASQLHAYWRFTVEIHQKKPDTGYLNKSVKSLFGDFRPVDITYSAPVIRDKGQYRVEARELPIKGIKSEYKFGAAFAGFFILWMSFSTSLSLSEVLKAAYYFSLAAVVVFSGLSLAILKGFERTSFRVVPRRDGGLRLRFLDLGKQKYKDLTVGLRIVSRQLSAEDGRSSYRRSLLYDQDYAVSDISRPDDLFREALIPWPEGRFPGSDEINEQGFIWEVYLRTKVFPFGVQEQAWPVEVDWEPFTIPETSQETKEELELQPLKETIEQRR